MAGNFGENEIIGLVSKVGKDSRRIDRAWPVIENKIRGISEYHQKFMNAYDDIKDHFMSYRILARSPRRSTGDKSGNFY